MTNKTYIVRYRLTGVCPIGEDKILWKEIVNRKDIHDNPFAHELIQEFNTKVEASAFADSITNIVTGWLLYKLQKHS